MEVTDRKRRRGIKAERAFAALKERWEEVRLGATDAGEGGKDTPEELAGVDG